MMEIPIFQVDAFTADPFGGNPAGVTLLEDEKPAEWMQSVAREMNLSETAFLLKKENGYDLRWFTPAIEVKLCGHATLASAHILWEQGYLKPDQTAVFFSASGELRACLKENWVELDFPSFDSREIEIDPAISVALGKQPNRAFKTNVNMMVEFDDPQIVVDLKPDFEKINQLPYQGIITTSRSESPQFDFISRYFAPHAGINEDPVTGSAHSSLGPFWAVRLGKTELHAFQASARGGELKVRVSRDRTFIAGQAVTIFTGKLLV
jgi:PhzF family phenazine biosynthesis protein